MNEQQTPKARQQFFIATYDGDQKNYVSSDHVVSISPVGGNPRVPSAGGVRIASVSSVSLTSIVVDTVAPALNRG